MTFLDKLKEEYPEDWEIRHKNDCPDKYGYDISIKNPPECGFVKCIECWDTEMVESESMRISKLEKANAKTEIPVNDCKENITPELVAELRKDKDNLLCENLALKEGIARLVLNAFGIDKMYKF